MDNADAALPDKPTGARLGWRVLETRYPHASTINRLRVDRVAIPGPGRDSLFVPGAG